MKGFTKCSYFKGFALVAALVLAACGGSPTEEVPDIAEEPTVEDAGGIFTAGTFSGVGTGGFGGNIYVDVVFDADTILDIQVTDHDETTGFADNAFDGMIPVMLRGQSTQVDTVSGATMTSEALIEAVNDAIVQAGADPRELISLYTPAVAEVENTEADLIVVGGGMSGLVTAIQAAQNGSSVIVLEKMGVLGGSTNYGGGISVTGSLIQEDVEYAITFEEFYQGWRGLEQDDPRQMGFVDEDRLGALIENSGARFDWLLDMGYDATLRPNGRMAVPTLPEGVMGWGGAFLVSFLEEQALALGVDIHLNTRGVELIQDGGAVTGIIADTPSGPVSYLAHNAVVLATGGFSHNQALMEEMIPELAPYVEFSTTAPGHMGDGHLMIREVDGAIRDDQWLIGLALQNEFSGLYMGGPGILVNHDGNRFVMESRPPGFIDHYTYIYNYTVHYSPGGAFLVFDSSEPFEFRVGQVTENLDSDNAFTGETIEELALAMGVPAQTLQEEIDLMNAVYRGEAEDRFGRTVGLNPLETGPFFAMRLFPADMGTIGGVVVNDYYQVIDNNGDVIQGLFAVGELSNRKYIVPMYFSGLSLNVALTGGMIAGEAASQ